MPVSYTHLTLADERSSVDLGGRRIIKKKKQKVHIDQRVILYKKKVTADSSSDNTYISYKKVNRNVGN